jgi:hypothetical protein
MRLETSTHPAPLARRRPRLDRVKAIEYPGFGGASRSTSACPAPPPTLAILPILPTLPILLPIPKSRKNWKGQKGRKGRKDWNADRPGRQGPPGHSSGLSRTGTAQPARKSSRTAALGYLEECEGPAPPPPKKKGWGREEKRCLRPLAGVTSTREVETGWHIHHRHWRV